MGSDKNVELKTYIILRALEAYMLDLTVITEMRHHGESCKEDYIIDTSYYKVFFAGPQIDIRIRNHGMILALKATRWAEMESQWEPISN